jgi:cytochrome c551/c552
MRLHYFIILIVLSMTCSAQSPSDKYQTVVNQYCMTCHNDQLKTAGLTLQDITTQDIGGGAEKWEKVLRKLKVRTMPPAGMPRPDAATYEGFSQYLEGELDKYAEANPHPGRPAMRRINRTEYSNVIRDLLAVEIDEESLLPPDDSMFGFNNIGNVLTLSPVLTEQYIAAARKVRRQALGDANIQPSYEIYTLSNNTRQEERLSEDLPFGSRGGLAVKHYFPANGEYEIQVRLQRNSRDYIRGLQDDPQKVDFRLDGKRIDIISIGGEKLGRSSGIFSTASQGDIAQEHYERTADDALYVKFYSDAGYHDVVVTFLKDNSIAEKPVYPKHTNYDFAQYKGGLAGIRSVSVGGPFNPSGMSETVSRNRIFTCKPKNINDDKCAESILKTLASRAFRRQPEKYEMQELMAFFKRGQKEGSFDEGLGLALERILAGPEFLFILEAQPDKLKTGETFKISPHELVTKLALFIWSSFPDVELLALAESGKILDSRVLNQQVQRMLVDPRADTLLNNFALQWLNLGRLNAAAPDTELFPYFDDNLRAAFKKETELFVDYVIKEDRPLLELLDASYTFVNDKLAEHYGIPGVSGSHFRKVTLSDRNRGGLLGQGSILTITSYANRTSPVIRGKWVLENLLGSPPPPPPPNVPGLRDKNDQGKVLSMRARMEQHRANPVCASCHKVMDPIGFALENYDGIGKWRTVDSASGSVIDPSGALPDSTPFSGPAGLKEVILDKRSEVFILTFVEKILTYGLGREVNYQDASTMREIMKKTRKDQHKISSLITAIVESTPFQTRRAVSHDDI